MRPALSILVALPLVMAACATGGRPHPPDSGSGMDAGRPADAGRPPDARGRDGGPMPGPDSGDGIDSGRVPDGGDPPLVRDGGPDGGGPECTTAADCTNGLACDGIERCLAGECGPGTPVACDDGIACTRDGCVEPGTCAFMADATLCSAGESCDVGRGCVSGCTESPCRLVAPQCGCPAGQGCYVDGTGTRLCATAGAAARGATCTSTTSCSAGNLCININPTGMTNICSHFCTTDLDCGAGSLCIVTLSDGAGGSLPGVRLCTSACDPVRQTGCPTGALCDIFQESAGAMRLMTDCTAPPGSGGQGAACVDNGDCRGGFACIDPDGPGAMGPQCLHWCELPSATGCPGGTTCFGFGTPLLVAGQEYGVCD